MRAARNGRAPALWNLATLVALAAFSSLSCAATEETTPRGFVIAPSVPADAGTIAGDAGA